MHPGITQGLQAVRLMRMIGKDNAAKLQEVLLSDIQERTRDITDGQADDR